MLDLLLLSVAFTGSLACGLIDLKTTEIPDQIPNAMALSGVLVWAYLSLAEGSYMPLLMSALVGTSYLALGWAFYMAKQWGGGDAKLLAAVGYLLPVWLTESSGLLPFSAAYLFNVFVVGLVYMLIYIMFLGLLRKKIRRLFLEDFRDYGWKVSLALVVFSVLSYFFLPLWLIVLVDMFGLSILYAKSVENYFFRSIPVSELREGDVLADGKIDGLTKKQVAKLKKKGGNIKIKDGVRYGLVFFLSLVVTLYYGSLAELIIMYLI